MKILRLALLTGLLLVAGGCSDPTDPIDDGGITQEESLPTSPTVVSTSPVGQATGVARNTTIRATFSADMDPATLTTTTFRLSPSTPGTVSYANRTATFTPSGELAAGTQYTATITTGARDPDGNALAAQHAWSFTTAVPAVPPAVVPLADGRRWRYTGVDTSSACASSTGCQTTGFEGVYFLHVEGQEHFGGRDAWRVMVYKLQSSPGSGPAFNASVRYLHQDGTGLSRWFSTGTGGEWRRILSTTSTTVMNPTFYLVGGPSHQGRIDLAPGSASVPAGSFSTLRAVHDFTQSGQYVTVFIRETRVEHFADGVGFVLGNWNYIYNPQDPQATSLFSNGGIALTHVDDGPFPDFIAEAEPNDSTHQANAVSPFAIVSGDIHITDPGALMNDAAVGCAQTCIHPNVLGEKRIQDWYRLDITETRDMRVELAFDWFDAATVQYNDLDVYVFQEHEGALYYIGASLAEPGKPEILWGTLQPGTYYFAVQAWQTPGARVRYWMSFR